MEKVIEAILKLIPFVAAFGYWGISKDTSTGLAALVVAFLLLMISPWIKKLQQNWKNARITNDLAPYFYKYQVENARKLFIPTRFQNNSPAVEDEPKFSHKFVVKGKLIDWFIKTGFNEKKETEKFYLILADSGMGKTTFMINLYVQYNSFFNFGKKYKIKLLPFGDSRIIDNLKEMVKKQDEVKDTILLLDAFDEYKGLLPPETPDGLTDDERFRKRLDEIVELTRDFREVVITSRTQYFPGQENQAYELKVPRFDDKGFHTLAKLYLSPFDTKEIRQYLCKKYGYFAIWNREKKRIAQSIVESSPKLMVRPMLLAYIDYLVDGNQKYTTTYQIYETLIEKWIDREATKRKYESTTREKFKNDLQSFSNLIALELYKQHKQAGNLSIDKEGAKQLCLKNGINLQDYEITGQSLLTRDITQNWKFSHKSILEFFLAKHCIDNFEFALTFEFAGMDMAKQFYDESGKFKFIKGGTFKLGGEYPVTVSDFYLWKYLVTQAEYVKITGKENPSHFKDSDKNPVEQVSWFEAADYCNLLNKQAGYKPVYDKEGNLLDSNGNITTDITKVKGFRLPTEAEWEYAARGGVETLHATSQQYSGSNNIDEVAWYEGNSGKKTHPVGQKKPNQLGLYDMSGNVWEWCYDWYADDFYKKNSEMLNPVNCSKGTNRVLRGGSGWIASDGCSPEYRLYWYAFNRDDYLGFRLAFVP